MRGGGIVAAVQKSDSGFPPMHATLVTYVARLPHLSGAATPPMSPQEGRLA